jgi:hypothetical protein
VEFEYDAEKSRTNADKHGIDFGHAQDLWQDAGLLTLPARSESEARFLAVGRIMDRHYTAVFTERAERIRLISVRRSRAEERDLYERNQ